MKNPTISICIPAYKNKAFLERLLDSIKIQSYKNFEVVITDDSPDNELSLLIETYKPFFDILYVKNSVNLNTPENWNEAVRNAKYEWIKIMHDDDWFVDINSLRLYAEAIEQHPAAQFFFSAYQNIYFEHNRTEQMKLSFTWYSLLRKNPEVLISKNVVGPPSVTLYRKSSLLYDKTMKYVVDIDFYTSYLAQNRWVYIPQVLINVGIHASQVTKYTFGFSEFHFNESVWMLMKKGDVYFKHPVVFDGWWRLIRNFNIDSPEKFNQFNLSDSHVKILNGMIKSQRLIGIGLLKNGVISKITMFISYLRSRI